MDIKKIIIPIIFLLFIAFVFLRNYDTKELKGTQFVLLNIDDSFQSCVIAYDNHNEGFYQSITLPTITDVFWDKQYVLAKCERNDSINYYIIKIPESDTLPVPWIRYGPMSIDDYLHYKDSLKFKEYKMNYENYYKSWWEKLQYRDSIKKAI